MRVPKQKNGNVGIFCDDKMIELGYPLNKTSTVDIEALGVEDKTRDTEATSAQTIGCMTIDDIINTTYDNSAVKQKFQQQFRIKHSGIFLEITSAKMYDFRDPYIQKFARDAYESGREVFKKNSACAAGNPKYVRGSGADFYREKKPGTENSYQFRLSDSKMKQYEQMATSTFNSLFEQIQNK